jgi:hypothetical protein
MFPALRQQPMNLAKLGPHLVIHEHNWAPVQLQSVNDVCAREA